MNIARFDEQFTNIQKPWKLEPHPDGYRFKVAYSIKINRKRAISRETVSYALFIQRSRLLNFPHETSHRCDWIAKKTVNRERTYGPPTLTFPNDCVTRVYRLPMHFRRTLCARSCSVRSLSPVLALTCPTRYSRYL